MLSVCCVFFCVYLTVLVIAFVFVWVILSWCPLTWLYLLCLQHVFLEHHFNLSSYYARHFSLVDKAAVSFEVRSLTPGLAIYVGV